MKGNRKVNRQILGQRGLRQLKFYETGKLRRS
jgi:hypothetical protein